MSNPSIAAQDGVSLIAAERRRQIEDEGYTSDHDESHRGALALAAASYALPSNWRGRRNSSDIGGRFDGEVPACWPWAARYWKPTPTDRVRELVKAGALIAAELDRLAGDAS